MSLRFIDGFDHYTYNDIFSKWTTKCCFTSVTILDHSITANGRNSGSGLRTANGTTALVKVLDTQPTYVTGFAFRANNPTSSVPTYFLGFMDNGTIQTSISFNTSNNSFYWRRGTSTVLGSSTYIFPNNTYIYLECKYTPSANSQPNTCIMRANGVNIINLASGTNTKSTSNSSINAVILGCDYASNGTIPGTLDFDDLYVCDLSGITNNDFLGDVRVTTLYPNGNGNYSQFVNSNGNSSNNYTLVNNSQIDSDTSYVENSGTGKTDSYVYSDLPVNAATIYGVQFCGGARKTDGGFRNLGQFIRSGGTDYFIASGNVNDTYSYQTTIQETNPASSSTWTVNNVNSLEAGIKLLS